jgi:hypothetical protein
MIHLVVVRVIGGFADTRPDLGSLRISLYSGKISAKLYHYARESLLETYEPERIGFARRLVATTDRIFTLVTKQGVQRLTVLVGFGDAPLFVGG